MPVLGGLFVDGGPRNRLKPARVASLLSSRGTPSPLIILVGQPFPFLTSAQRRGTPVQLRGQIETAGRIAPLSLESAVSDLTARRVPALLELV